MKYKMIKIDEREIRLEKHMESKGFFRNATGPSKVGEIRLLNDTKNRWFEDFITEEDGTYYMEAGRVIRFSLQHPDEVPQIFIGDNVRNLPIEERIKFLYEAFINANYNYLAILHRDPDRSGHKLSLFEITKHVGVFDDDIATFNINDL